MTRFQIIISNNENVLQLQNKLIPEQSPGEANPLFQMAISTQPPHTTQTKQ